MLNYPVKLEKLFLGVFSFNFIMLISGSNIGGDSHLFGVELLQILEQPLLDKGATKSSFLGLFVHVSLQSRKVQLSFSFNFMPFGDQLIFYSVKCYNNNNFICTELHKLFAVAAILTMGSLTLCP